MCRSFAATAPWPLAPRARTAALARTPADASPATPPVADRASTSSIVRALLAVVAVEIIVVSVPALLGDGQATSTHAARHLGAFAVAYGVGLLVVVARPARARTMLPVAAVLAGALVITAVVDLTQRRIPLVGRGRPPSGGRECRVGLADRRAVASITRWSRWCCPPPTRTRRSAHGWRGPTLPAKRRSAVAWYRPIPRGRTSGCSGPTSSSGRASSTTGASYGLTMRPSRSCSSTSMTLNPTRPGVTMTSAVVASPSVTVADCGSRSRRRGGHRAQR